MEIQLKNDKNKLTTVDVDRWREALKTGHSSKVPKSLRGALASAIAVRRARANNAEQLDQQLKAVDWDRAIRQQQRKIDSEVCSSLNQIQQNGFRVVFDADATDKPRVMSRTITRWFRRCSNHFFSCCVPSGPTYLTDYTVHLPACAYLHYTLIAGVPTFFSGPMSPSGLRPCYWVTGVGRGKAVKIVHGYVYGDYHVVAQTEDRARALAQQAQKKGKKAQILDDAKLTPSKRNKLKNTIYLTVSDSLAAGNCKVGTLAFLARHNIDPESQILAKTALDFAKSEGESVYKRCYNAFLAACKRASTETQEQKAA